MYILIVAIVSTMMATSTSSSITTHEFDTSVTCMAAGQKAEKALGGQLWGTKVTWVCVQK